MKEKHLIILAVTLALWLILSARYLFAEEQAHESHDGSKHYHLNALELFLGNTYEDGDHGDENGFSTALTYERRLSELFGVGVFFEYTAGDFDKWSIGTPLFIHPYKGLRFAAAPGLERRHGNEEFLFRAGVGYEFELDEQWIFMPEFNVDFVDGQEALVFGASFGIGF